MREHKHIYKNNLQTIKLSGAMRNINGEWKARNTNLESNRLRSIF